MPTTCKRKMPPKRPRKDVQKITAKRRKEIVAAVRQEEYHEVVEESVIKIFAEHQFKYYPHRLTFIETFKELPMKVYLLSCIENMKDLYLDLLHNFCKGKKSLALQNSWFMHVNLYFDTTFKVDGITTSTAMKLSKAWKDLVLKAKCTLSNNDQRIILSTISYIIFDLMSHEVKKKKADEGPSTSLNSNETDCPSVVDESMVSIYRYAGLAVHSMMDREVDIKRKEILESLKCKQYELDKVPKPVQDLNQANLCIVSPTIIPFVQGLLRKINAHISRDQLALLGKNMIEVAKPAVMNDTDLPGMFESCVAVVDECDKHYLNSIRIELSRKIFNARVNEFFKANNELCLEADHKVVDANQSLRDTLKTYSIMQSRIF